VTVATGMARSVTAREGIRLAMGGAVRPDNRVDDPSPATFDEVGIVEVASWRT